MNLRLWTWADGGPVKLTLRPGQSLRWSYGGPHEEGYCWTMHTWTHTNDPVMGVIEVIETRGRCCDGPHESYGKYWCPASQLRSGPLMHLDKHDEYGEPIPLPNSNRPTWQALKTSQRDHYAEAAGY